MSDPLLTIHNLHAAGSGDPPIVSQQDGNTYIGYFENRHGEQWIFVCDRKTGESFLRGGDIGWNTRHPVVAGEVGDLNLSDDERSWLSACVKATLR